MALAPSPDQLIGLRDAASKLIVELALPRLQARPDTIFDKDQKEAEFGNLYDVVTNVDTEIEAALLPKLETLLPGSMALGEEGFKQLENPGAQPVWLLDPLDGTLNFARGLPGFGLSLALLVEARPVMGVVIDGITGLTFDAVEGHGARCGGQMISLDPQQTGKAPMCLSSGVWNLIAERGGSSLLADLLVLNPRIRLIGSQALQLCYVARGALCLNVNREARLWDDAAGALIVREAGGCYERMCGRNLFPLSSDDPALTGAPLFSLAGTPEMVDKARSLLTSLVD